MRKQYYFRPSDAGVLPWDVDRLVQLPADLPRKRVALGSGIGPAARRFREQTQVRSPGQLRVP